MALPVLHYINPSLSRSLPEADGSYSWGVNLAFRPSDNVTVTYEISDPSEAVFSNGLAKFQLFFTPDNWNIKQDVLLKSVDDDVVDGSIAYTVKGYAYAKLDNKFWGQNRSTPLNLGTLSFKTLDDDSPDEIQGTSRNDDLQGGVGQSDIYGNAGNDTAKGGKGDDRIYGGYGDDILYGQEGNDHIEGEQGRDYIQGDAGNDEIEGGSESDEIYGGSGDDSLNGGTGADQMYGGDGSDTYYVDNAGDYVSDTGLNGTDVLYVMSYLGSNYQLGDGLDNLVIDSSARNVNVMGNSSNNSITGNDSRNAIDGGLGNDNLDGGSGDDSILGGEGFDLIIGGLGADSIDGGNGIDTIDYTQAAAGFVSVNLSTGKSSGDGNDALKSIENVICGEGDDTIIGSIYDNVFTGGDGFDSITGGSGRDVFRYTSLLDSDLTSNDWIKDLAIGSDSIDAVYAVSKGFIAGTKSGSGLKVTAFSETSIQKTLTASVFSAKGAAVFTYQSSSTTQTYLALNDTVAGFQSSSDSLINITGFTGSLANLAII